MDSKPEPRLDDLQGLSPADAKEYIFRNIAALKLMEKEQADLKAAFDKWKGREELARSKNAPDLAEEAGSEAGNVQAKLDALEGEAAELRALIENMRRQLPGLAARERSIDPDLLEQELKIALGETPGEENSEKKVKQEIDALNTEAALEALKAKMGLGAQEKAGGGEENP
ncbi:MAG: PspA/IM30 family protein [Treponema sp.]|jgi:phage shock protein A|nr:PspA/IM30 family protein [Treponema sp.]